MPIGQFAAASGLTTDTLRHYDRVNVLCPAEIDARTRYRRYRREQIRIARLIRYLRSADLSIGEIKKILQDETNPITVLRGHHRRLASERKRLRALMRRINRLTHDVASVVSEGILNLEAIELLTPEHYLFEHEVMLETTHMTIEEAVEAEGLLCALYDVGWLQFTFDEETRSEWTILIPRTASAVAYGHMPAAPAI